MCLIVFARDCHPRYSLVLAANRDEFRQRQATPAAFWDQSPQLLAGRDLQAGGTWLGVTTGGRFAAITNYRDMRQQVADPPSRGGLVSGFLQSETTIVDFTAGLARDAGRYDGFNLLYGSCRQLHYFTNRGGSSGPVAAGIHALSNHLLDSPWPKVTVAKSRLATILEQDTIDPESLFSALHDPVPFADELLPDTGIGPDLERFLSPLFIDGPVYGTRSTTVLLVTRDGQLTFCERSYGTGPATTVSFDVLLGDCP